MDAKHEVETTAETVDEAVSAALRQLNASASEVLVEVLEEPSRGILGIGSKPARVRVKLLAPPAPEPSEPTPDPAPEPVQPVDDTPVPTTADTMEATEDESAEADVELTDETRIARDVLLELLGHMGIEGDIDVYESEPSRPGEDAPMVLDISGEQVRELIGRRGETLNALQYITRLIASRHLQRRANIIIDADGYKSRRSDKLRQLAERMADQAVKQGRPVTLEPMPPNERRIIHMELREREDVETESTGEGSSRKVTINPIQQDIL